MDHHAVDAAVEPCPQRGARPHLCGDARHRRQALHIERGRARDLQAPTPRRHPHRRHQRIRARGPHLCAPVRLLRGYGPSRSKKPPPRHEPCLRRPRRRLHRHLRRHRGRTHGTRIRRGRPACGSRSRHRHCGTSRRFWLFHRRSHRLGRCQRARGQRRDHQGVARHRSSCSSRQLHPQLPALLAHRHAHHLQGHAELVRESHRDPRPSPGDQPGDQLGAWPYPRRPLRHVARRCKGLVDLAQPFLGLSHPRLGQRQPRFSPHRRVRQPR